MLHPIPPTWHAAAAVLAFALTLGGGLLLDGGRPVVPEPQALRAAAGEDRAPLPSPPAEAVADVTLRLPPPAEPMPHPRLADFVPASFEVAPSMPKAGGPACAPRLDARPAPLASVDLVLAAPCARHAAAVIRHEGMAFTVQTDAEGTARVRVPALAEAAAFQAEVGGLGAAARARVPEVARYERAVLQWRGPAGPNLHAREFGAAFGGPGHVWAGAPGQAAAAEQGLGGVLVRLGDPLATSPYLAQVYTFPAGLARRGGRVDLSVEAEVTPRSCGREMAARTIQVSPGGPPVALDLVLALPSCEAVGERVVVEDMLLDFDVAAG